MCVSWLDCAADPCKCGRCGKSRHQAARQFCFPVYMQTVEGLPPASVFLSSGIMSNTSVVGRRVTEIECPFSILMVCRFGVEWESDMLENNPVQLEKILYNRFWHLYWAYVYPCGAGSMCRCVDVAVLWSCGCDACVREMFWRATCVTFEYTLHEQHIFEHHNVVHRVEVFPSRTQECAELIHLS